MAAIAASRGFSSGVVKVLVSFYKSGEDSAFDRHRSRVTFDLSKQSSVVAVKKHLREFLGLDELALKFGMADFKLKLCRLQRSCNGKTENYSIVSQQRWEMEIPWKTSVVFRYLRKSLEIFLNDRESSESGRKLLDILNKITLPFLEPFLSPSGQNLLLHRIFYC